MCYGSSAKDIKREPTPPEPETVKYTESEMAKARSSAKDAAAKKYGIAGTNVTKGALASDENNVKRKTLGGE